MRPLADVVLDRPPGQEEDRGDCNLKQTKKKILLNIFFLVAFKQKEESDYFPCSRLVKRKRSLL